MSHLREAGCRMALSSITAKRVERMALDGSRNANDTPREENIRADIQGHFLR
jgi:hypothetical protein